jgi:hypothetical protein
MASTVKLDGDEIAKIAQNRKSPRPSYYDAQATQQRQISSDFESFLILQDPITISATLTWLSATAALVQPRLDRDAVAFEALVSDSGDCSDRKSEVLLSTAAFNLWREKFQGGKFSDVPEVGLLIRDAQAPADELFALEDRLSHLEQVQSRVRDGIRQSVSRDQLQEIMSWPTPLLAY